MIPPATIPKPSAPISTRVLPTPLWRAAAKHRPAVVINMAMTADGKTATANRAVASFGSKTDLQNLYRLRATADAILCGARTLDLDAVKLGNGGARFDRQRRRAGLADHPIRIIASARATIDPNAELFRHDFSPILLLTSRAARTSRVATLRPHVAAVHVSPGQSVNWQHALRWLANQWGVRRLLVEGGGSLNGALVRADVVDELCVTVCPVLCGGESAATLADGPSPISLREARTLTLHAACRRGDEFYLHFTRTRTGIPTVAGRQDPRAAQ